MTTPLTPEPTQTEDSLADFERLLGRPRDGQYVLRLYVAGMTPHSERAIRNITKLCDDRLSGRYSLSVVDLYQSPDAASGEGILCAPTLVKQLPLPLRRLIGDLSDTNRVLIALDITP